MNAADHSPASRLAGLGAPAPAANPAPKPAADPAAAGPRAWLGLLVWRHGLWAPLVLGLLAAAAALAWDGHLAAARSAAALPLASAAQRPGPAASAAVAAALDAQRLAEFRQGLVPQQQATASVRQLVALTRPALAWTQAEFQQSDNVAPGVLRLQITVPVAGAYPAMREAIAKALLQMPALSLDQVTLRRDQAGTSQLTAQLRFSLWLAAAPAAGGAP